MYIDGGVILNFFCYIFQMIFYGDVEDLKNLKSVENAIFISNHQSTSKWKIFSYQ